VWETYDDHRFVMAGFLLASLCPQIKIKNPKCVEKTAPQFFEIAKKLGFESIFC
jgi:3-phosphoshikimate 1-carboxyvinyltransferase